MLNIEKYEKEIIDIGLNTFGYTKDTGVKRCDDIHCCDCIFCDNRMCSTRKIVKWLASEYKEPLLSDEAINYLMTLILPYGLNELDCIIKINLCDELKYKLCVHLKDCIITVYFQRGTELCHWFDNLEKGKYYNAKELGLC